MDAVRQIRLFIPPFFFFGALLFLAYQDNDNHLWKWLMARGESEGLEMLQIIVAVGALSLPLGFLIGTVTRLGLEIISCIVNWKSIEPKMQYDAWHNDNTSKKALALVNMQLKNKDKETFVSGYWGYYAVITFDHHILYNKAKGVSDWLVRRWSGFNICANSVTALILVPIASWLLELGIGWGWKETGAMVVTAMLLTVAAWSSWEDSRRMFVFQANRDWDQVLKRLGDSGQGEKEEN